MTADLRHKKKELRRAMELRRTEAYAQNPNAAIALRDNFLQHIKLPPGAIVSGFSAMGHEIDPAPLMKALHDQGYALALPVVTGKGVPLVFRAYAPGDTLTQGVMNISEPSVSATIVEPDVLLVPLLAFDKKGNRLGYGGGYYDRTLAGLRARKPILAIGIAFACQEVAEVPVGHSDVPLDKVVTEIKHFQP